MVAGGLLADQFTSISSTEMLAPGSDSWTLATPLPSARTGLVGVTVDNRLYMTGKHIILLLGVRGKTKIFSKLND